MQWVKSEANTEAKKEICRLQIDVIAKLGHSQRQKEGNSQGTRTGQKQNQRQKLKQKQKLWAAGKDKEVE